MLFLMQLKSPSSRIGFATPFKLANERLLTRMGQFVCHHVTLCYKSGLADPALVGFIACLKECLNTELTCVRMCVLRLPVSVNSFLQE